MRENDIQTQTLHIRGMFCQHCETRIRKALISIPGVRKAEVSYEKETAVVSYDSGVVTEKMLREGIEAAGYDLVTDNSQWLQSTSILVIFLALWLIAKHFGWTAIFNFFPRIDTKLSLGALFVTGLLTSVHCIAMCGGINLSQSMISAAGKISVFRSNALYQAGRIISYSVTGAIVGGLGSVLSIGGRFKGAVAVIAGYAMLLMALNMLDFFKLLRKIHIPLLPFLNSGGIRIRGSESSFVIGLLNGLMPCGPLQSMQLYALSTGSISLGALSMLMFGLGTIPLMLVFGLLTGVLNRKHTRIMLTVSAVLILIMGLNMVGNGLSLSGFSLPEVSTAKAVRSMVNGDVQTVRTEIDYGTYPPVQVRAGIPVIWTIIVPEGKLNGCNSEILIPDLNMDLILHEGENVLEFTVDKPGLIPFSCWMGMIRSSIEVTE